ncbi:alpha/beta-hydrolase N-terminal domain-containing protein [Thalassorhabdomicrobium marinisediminis]|uniref:alpha/beta-hydrolase N-terminal domain-containing protein n=1 Tax=Thalassorhabdomicrobium marinisediminis TaxID=2170577 RepID=UPI0024901BA9|nr:alpha/beta-hydrolase N-terminal domain-containing protein [Thalassorhabdomicrobium marinisediminis]
MALGYLIGRISVTLWRLMELPEPRGRTVLIARLVTGVPVLIILTLCLINARDWQNSIREPMGMELLDSVHTLRMIVLAVTVFAVLVLIGYSLHWLFMRFRSWLYRYLPRRTANVAGFLLTVVVVVGVTRDGVLDRVISGLDASMTAAQNLFDTAPPIPDGTVTGGEGSLVGWGALGQPGRNFATTGPDAADIAAFT